MPQSRALKRQLRALLHVLQDPELHFFWILMTLTLIAGTAFYSLVEGWSVLDALFFSVITLTTVGYGNLSPSTPGSKIFTIVYILVGIGIFLTLVNKLASGALRRSRELRDERDQSEKAP